MNDIFEKFIARWSASSAAERANKDSFLSELCDVLGVERPVPATGDRECDLYVFECKVKISEEDGLHTKSIDLYKRGCFILEAKQGSEQGATKIGTAKRGTPGWNIAMKDAFGQALGYADGFDEPPPFVIVCDIGYCFDLYAVFDGTKNYRPFPNAQSSRIFLSALPKHAELLRAIWTNPKSLDPSRLSIKVTREVAAHLAELARTLNPENDKQREEPVAKFLMRCLFTMFAEDVGLLPDKLFTNHIREYWIPNPKAFPNGIRALWKAMNTGDDYLTGKLLKFNGGLFANQDALPLDETQLKLLLAASERDWAEVEPAIFGTLLERALNTKERHALGAHFTPKAYVERLVRPTIEEPLRADWDVVQAQVRQLVAAAEEEEGKKRKDLIAEARKAVRDFHSKLCAIRVLDPACGSGNFLYVTLDLFKRLESEVFALLDGLGETQTMLDMASVTVNPSQFLGIEVKPWAKEIAELVLWIGYLQWHFRTYGRGQGDKKIAIPEPVLRDYKNIECRDAVLAYDSEELLRDEKGKPVTRWDGETMKTHPVTGKDVPDDSAQIPVYKYINPRKADWPKADFIVGNPPFIAGRNLRRDLGDGYIDVLEKTYPEMSTNQDFVMWFWQHAAEFVGSGSSRRMGLITTSRIRMQQNQPPLERALASGNRIVFAIPDHPWPGGADSAKVRVAMTVLTGHSDTTSAVLALADDHDQVTRNRGLDDSGECKIEKSFVDAISADLSPSVSIEGLLPLLSNSGLDSAGVKPYASSLVIEASRVPELFADETNRKRHSPPYRNGRDIGQRARGVHVIDFWGLSEKDVADRFPSAYQYLLTHTKPERAAERNPRLRREWWLFEANRPEMRAALAGQSRYIATVENSPVRVFVFLDESFLPDQKLRIVASNDSFILGVLSSRAHQVFAERRGGRHGVANTPVYNSRCFAEFSFPLPAIVVRDRIRFLGDALDAHRKRQQAAHSDLTITGMYNVLEKLRTGEVLTAKDKIIHEHGLVSVLKKIHDDLDAAVFDAYGWPQDLTDEQILERLVALNAERVEEEKRGIIRWLRPEYQMKVVKHATPPAPNAQIEIVGAGFKPARDEQSADKASVAPPAAKKKPWPKTLPQRIAAVRDLAQSTDDAWTAEAVAKSFTHAQVKSVEPLLDSLAAIGVLKAYNTRSGRRWKRTTK